MGSYRQNGKGRSSGDGRRRHNHGSPILSRLLVAQLDRAADSKTAYRRFASCQGEDGGT